MKVLILMLLVLFPVNGFTQSDVGGEIGRRPDRSARSDVRKKNTPSRYIEAHELCCKLIYMASSDCKYSSDDIKVIYDSIKLNDDETIDKIKILDDAVRKSGYYEFAFDNYHLFFDGYAKAYGGTLAALFNKKKTSYQKGNVEIFAPYDDFPPNLAKVNVKDYKAEIKEGLRVAQENERIAQENERIIKEKKEQVEKEELRLKLAKEKRRQYKIINTKILKTGDLIFKESYVLRPVLVEVGVQCLGIPEQNILYFTTESVQARNKWGEWDLYEFTMTKVAGDFCEKR